MTANVSGLQLKAARTLLGVTQRQLAERLGLSVDTVWRAECDRPGSQRTGAQLRGLLVRNGIHFAADGSVRRAPAAGAEYRAWLQRWA